MILSPLEILDLQDELSSLLNQLGSADPLSQLDLQDSITSVLEKLGFDEKSNNREATNKDDDRTPKIVIDYLSGSFSSLSANEFIKTLEDLEPFVSTFISMPQICDGANDWWDTTGKKLVA